MARTTSDLVLLKLAWVKIKVEYRAFNGFDT
jgi:hypothetical protein